MASADYTIGYRTLADQIDQVREEELRYIETLREQLTDRERDLEKTVGGTAERYRLGYEAHEKLTAAGFSPDAYPTNMDVYCDVRDLPRIYQAIGSVRCSYKRLREDTPEGEQDRVTVTVTSVKYPMVKVHYTKPFVPNQGKCRIVREAKLETRLVCDRH